MALNGLKTIFNSAEAAEFLKIGEEKLSELVKEGVIRKWRGGSLKEYFLAGELDAVRGLIGHPFMSVVWTSEKVSA